ncbi:MAG: hypothetical protein WCI97_07280, partial [Bacteroidota bacterium]
EIESVEDALEYKLNDNIDILIYNNLSDLKQSNIGYGVEQNNTGGTTKIIGNKMFVYFNGNHNDLLKQIREGLAKICLDNMMFGSNIQEILQNAVLLNLPSWYTEGLAAYIAKDWSTELDNRLRIGILSGKYKNFNKLTGEDAKFAGQALWYYIARNYGATSIPNILYLTRINRSVESGFNFVIGKTMRQLINDFNNYYGNQYALEQSVKTDPNTLDKIPIKTRKGRKYYQFKPDPTFDKVAYCENELGKYKVKVYDTEKKHRRTYLRGGFKNISQPIDYSYPLTAWDPTGTKLAMVIEKRGKLFLSVYDFETKKKSERVVTNFQKILSISFGADPKSIVMSAVNRSQSDIYIMNYLSGKIDQITNDFYDDLNPHFVKLSNRTIVLWSSNRLDDTLRTAQLDTLMPLGNFDLYYYNLKTRDKLLTRVTTTPNANEGNATGYTDNFFCYTSDKNGINNRYVAYIDSVFDHYNHFYYFKDSVIENPKYNIDSLIAVGTVLPDSTKKIPVYRDVAHSFPNTNYSNGILEQENALKAHKMAELYFANGKYFFAVTKNEVDTTKLTSLNNTGYTQQLLDKISAAEKKKQMSAAIAVDTVKKSADTTKVDINNYIFQSEFSQKTVTVTPEKKEEEKQTTLKKDWRIKFSKILPYYPRFSTDYVVSQLDDNLMINRYQSFAPNGGVFQNPGINGLIKLSTTDLFEDYRFTGGFRVPTTLGGNEYFFSFDNIKKRLDKKYTYYRHVITQPPYDASPYWAYPVYAKAKTNYFEAAYKYPIDYTKSIRGIASYRMEKLVFLGSDSFSLGLKDYNEDWVSIRGEYVFDNTLKIQTNILDGTRYKFYSEVMMLAKKNSPFLFVAGVDYRHYQKIHRNIIWATRFNAASSWGDGKIVYYLGGVDGWFVPRFSTATDVSTTANYAFQSLATNLRGFEQNIRNGNSFALVNTEIRFPVFSYLFNSPIRSEIIRNFQLVGFFDAGTAWQGFSPYSENNPFNTTTFNQGPITVQVNYFREPLVAGFGCGARTNLFGYFAKLDYARGFDSGVLNKRIWYFSIGTDF